MQITKQLEWDMGHRVTNHNSKCRNLHGHRYKLEVGIDGDLIAEEGSSSEGMIVDFSEIKSILINHVDEPLDHSFMVWKEDKLLMDFFNKNNDLKVVYIDVVPTAENIAKWIFDQINPLIAAQEGLKLAYVRVWETPTGSAIYINE